MARTKFIVTLPNERSFGLSYDPEHSRMIMGGHSSMFSAASEVMEMFVENKPISQRWYTTNKFRLTAEVSNKAFLNVFPDIKQAGLSVTEVRCFDRLMR